MHVPFARQELKKIHSITQLLGKCRQLKGSLEKKMVKEVYSSEVCTAAKRVRTR